MRKLLPILAMATAATVLCSGVFAAEATYVYEDDNIKLGNYTGLTYSVQKEEVTEEDIEEYIQSDLEDYSENLAFYQGTAEEGSMVNIDYVGTIDGEEFEGGSDTDVELTLGEGWFLEEFENGIIGMEVGETKDVTFTFPEDYNEEVAGKEVTFAITLNCLLEPEKAELTDAWVKDNMDMDSVEEYKESVKKDLEDDKESFFQTASRDELMTQILEKSVVSELPQDRKAYLYDASMAEWQSYATMFNMEFTDFVSQVMGMDETQFNDYLNESITDYLTQSVVLDKIAELEKIELSDEEFDQYLVDMGVAEQYESLDAFKEEISKDENMLENLRQERIEMLAFEWVLDHATFVPSENEEETRIVDEEEMASDEEMAEGALEVVTEEAAEATTEEATEATTEETAEATTEETAEATTEEAAEATTEEVVEATTEAPAEAETEAPAEAETEAPAEAETEAAA